MIQVSKEIFDKATIYSASYIEEMDIDYQSFIYTDSLGELIGRCVHQERYDEVDSYWEVRYYLQDKYLCK